MIFLSQRDERWRDRPLGVSQVYTVGSAGCTTTCISMLSDYFGCYKSPLQIASDVSNYTPYKTGSKTGLIIWNNLRFDQMKFVWREYGYHPENIREALANPNKAVILEVNNKKHWVVAYSSRWINNDFYCIDPWTGTKRKVLATYGNITGASYFERKELEKPQVVEDVEFGKTLGRWDYPFFLQADDKGQIWFIHSDGHREYIDETSFFPFMEKYANGISSADLAKIPLKK